MWCAFSSRNAHWIVDLGWRVIGNYTSQLNLAVKATLRTIGQLHQRTFPFRNEKSTPKERQQAKDLLLTNLFKDGFSRFVVNYVLVKTGLLAQSVSVIPKQDGLSIDCVRVTGEVLFD